LRKSTCRRFVAETRCIKNTHYDAVARVYLQTRIVLGRKGFNGLRSQRRDRDLAADVEPAWTTRDLDDLRTPGEAERITKLKESERIATTLKQLDGCLVASENFERGATKCWTGGRMVARRVGFVGFELLSASRSDGGFTSRRTSLTVVLVDAGGAVSGLRAVKEIDEFVKV
jgi:hypothetical protein